MKFARIPCADHESSACGIGLYLVYNLFDLVDTSPFRCLPVGPLGPVDPSQVSIPIGPLIPNGNPVVVEILYVGITFEEPEQFVDD